MQVLAHCWVSPRVCLTHVNKLPFVVLLLTLLLLQSVREPRRSGRKKVFPRLLCVFTSVRDCQALLPYDCAILSFPSRVRVPGATQTLSAQNCQFLFLTHLCHPDMCVVVSHCGFYCIFWWRMRLGMFSCVYCLYLFFGKLFKSFALLIGLFYYRVLKVFCVFLIQVLHEILVLQIFSLSFFFSFSYQSLSKPRSL